MTQFTNSALAPQSPSFASVSTARAPKPVAWQQFGKNFSSPVTIEEAIQEAGADYNVEKQNLVRVPQSVIDAIKNGTPMPDITLTANDIITSHCATFREDNDTTLGVVGSKYGVVQNSRAFDFIKFIKEVSGHEPMIETAGVLGHGERIFVSARLGEDSYLDPNDAIKNYVVFTNSHDGSGSVMAFFTPVRVICQNTLNMAIRGAENKVTFKHTSKVNERIDRMMNVEEERQKALAVFSASVNFSKQFIDRMLHFKGESVTDDYINEFVGNIFLSGKVLNEYKKVGFDLNKVDISTRSKNLITALHDSIESGIGQEFHRGSKLWLLNGLTTYLHSDNVWKTAQAEYESLMEGDGAKKVQTAYKFLMEN